MNYILFDDVRREQLLPLTFTRPVADIRIGILTIREKWERYLGESTSTLTEKYLNQKFPIRKAAHNLLINGSICPNKELVDRIQELKPGEVLAMNDTIVALHVTEEELDKFGSDKIEDGDKGKVVEMKPKGSCLKIENPWEVFHHNDQAIRADFELLTKGRKSQPLSDSNRVLGKENIFVEPGAKVEMAILNASTGPIYIGKDAEIMEGAILRGPVALCEHAVVKMAAKIYGPTTIGPYSKVGGEVNNSVLFGYSNKAHDGFLGNSVLGEWCNLGADTNTSNLKNTYDEVRVWSYAQKTFVPTGLNFCGLIMGDHSKSGINTMFNTGTVVGVNVNVFGSGFQRNFIESFSWGSPAGFRRFDIRKAREVARSVFNRRDRNFDHDEDAILTEVFNQSFKYLEG